MKTLRLQFGLVSLSVSAICFQILALRPLLKSGFYADDASNSLSFVGLESAGRSRWELIWNQSFDGPVPGRFYPLSNYVYFVFDFCRGNPVLYKSFVLALVVLSIFVFSLFVLLVFRNKQLALFSLFISPLFFQFRNFYDPITAYAGFMQILLITLLLSLIFANHFINTASTKALLLAILFFNLTLYLYEISYAFILLFFVLVLLKKPEIAKASLLLLPLLLSLSIAVLLSVAKRQQYELMPAYKSNFDLGAILVSIIKQTYASIPNSYLRSNSDIFQNPDWKQKLSALNEMDYVALVLFVACYALAFVTLKTWHAISSLPSPLSQDGGAGRTSTVLTSARSKLTIGLRKQEILFGLALAISPTLMISLSPTYQYLIDWGVSHIPVYLSYFGMILVFFQVVFQSTQTIRTSNFRVLIRHVFSVCLCVFLLVNNLFANAFVVEAQNSIYHYKREILRAAQSQSGLFDSVQTGDLVIFYTSDNLSLDLLPFLESLTGRKTVTVDARRLSDWYSRVTANPDLVNLDPNYDGLFGSSQEDLFLKYQQVFLLKYASNDLESGFALLLDLNALDSREGRTLVRPNSISLFLKSRRFTDLTFEKIYCVQAIPCYNQVTITPQNRVDSSDYFFVEASSILDHYPELTYIDIDSVNLPSN